MYVTFLLSHNPPPSSSNTIPQVLLLPTIFDKLNEKTLYIFGAVNALSIVAVWALYPESNQRTLEEMDLVFASDSWWTWDAERNFAKLKAENPDLIRSSFKDAKKVGDPESGVVGSRRASKVSTQPAEKEAIESAEKSTVSHH